MIVGFVVAVIVFVGALGHASRQPSLFEAVMLTIVGAAAAAAAVWTGIPLFHDGFMEPEAIAVCCVAGAIVAVIVFESFVRSRYTLTDRPAKLK